MLFVKCCCFVVGLRSVDTISGVCLVMLVTYPSFRRPDCNLLGPMVNLINNFIYATDATVTSAKCGTANVTLIPGLVTHDPSNSIIECGRDQTRLF